MEFVYNVVEWLVVFENIGVVFGFVIIYWFVLEIRKVKFLKFSWFIVFCVYLWF